MDPQGADGVEHGQDHDAHVREDGGPHARHAQGAEHQAQGLDAEGEDDVLIDDADALAGDADRLGDLQRVVVHEDHVRRLDGRVGAHRAHGDADVGAGEDGRVVDAVADEGQDVLRALLRQEALDLSDLLGGQQLAVDLVDVEVPGHLSGHRVDVAGEHDGLRHADPAQGGDRLAGVRLLHVGDHDVARVDAVERHVEDGPDAVAGHVVHRQLSHELLVPDGDGVAVDRRADALAAALLDVGHAAAVDGLAVGALEALADGVRRGALGQRGVFDELLRRDRVVVDRADLEDALGQGAGLVEDHGVGLREDLEVVRALHQHALAARAAEAREEAQRDADDQGARAADDQEGQGAVDPFAPQTGRPQREDADQRRQDRQRQRAAADRRGVHPREAGDERLGAGLVRAGVLDQLQDLGDGGLAELLRGADLQHARQVDAAADDLVALRHVAREALAGQGAGVQRRRAGDDHAVQRDLLTGLDHDDAADLHLVRVHLLEGPVPLDVRIVRADVHQRGDALAALADGVGLEQLADLVEQHDCDGLGEIAAALVQRQRDGADRGHRHEEVLIEHLSVQDALARLVQDVVADDQVGRQVQDRRREHGQRREARRDQQDRGDDDAPQHLLLLSVHGGPSIRSILEVRKAPQDWGAQPSGRSEIDLAVVLDALAALEHAGHDLLGVRALGEGHDHLLGHEVHHGVLDALGPLRRDLHLVRTVGAIDLDLIALLHDLVPPIFYGEVLVSSR